MATVKNYHQKKNWCLRDRLTQIILSGLLAKLYLDNCKREEVRSLFEEILEASKHMLSQIKNSIELQFYRYNVYLKRYNVFS